MRWLGLLGHYGLMGVYALVIGTLTVSILGILTLGLLA